ncbi:SRC kinase signaling inhibitor 1-like isoform X21 [Branchiostoma floridae x Branchiostoma belcheri]
MASNGMQRSLSVPAGDMQRGVPAQNNRATAPGHGRPIARPADDIQVKPNGTLNGHGGRKRHFNRDEPRRHTLGGPRSQMEMKRENSEMEKLERQRQAFLEHLKKKYPQHAQAISGHQKQTRTLSSSHVAEVMEEEDRASVASEQSEPAMGTANTGFSRGSRLRSSLPVVRTPILSKEKSKGGGRRQLVSLGIVYLQVNDETKRSIMPNEVTGLDTVRAMFVRAFPHRLTMQIMEQPHIKIYIRDSKSDVYYELEEMKEVQDRACLKIHVPGLADTLPMYHTPSPNSTLSSTTVSNVSLVIEEDGTDSVRNGPSPHPDMARQRQPSPRYQTAVHNTSHQTYQLIKQSNEQKIQQLSNHVSESGSSSEHSTPKQQSPQSTVQRQPHPYPQSRGPPPPMSGPPKPAHAAPPPPASPRHTQGGPPPPQHQQQQVSRQQTTYYVSQSQAAPQPNIQPPQHGAPHPQAGSPHPHQGSPHPQQGSPHPQQGAPHPRTSPHSPHVAQQHATYVYAAQQVPQQRGTPPPGHPQRGTPPQGRPQGHPQGHPGMPAGVPKSASMPNYYQHRPAQGPRPAGPGQPHPIQRSGSAGPPPAHAGRHPGQKMHPSQHAPAMYQRQTSGPGSGGSRASPVMGTQPRGRRSLPHLTGSDVEDEVIQQLRTGHRRGYGSSQTSGTSSPIVNDDEARKRMASIEQQIASLAGLVQTALTHGDETQAASAGTTAVPGKDEDKGRHPSVTRSESSHSGFSAESVSTVSGRASSPVPDEQVAEKARRLHHTTKGLREQLNQLRIIHRHNTQEMNDTFEKVKREIQVRLSRSPSGSMHPVRTQRSRVDLEMHNYRKRAEIVEKKLSELERWVEEVRTDVVNKRCRVSVGDVEAMLKALSRSEKDWRELQDTWPGLNEELKAVLSAEMEVVVQEERFVKDETDKVEGALKRIKKLTGTLHTLQRLASVQEHRPAQVPVFEQKGEPDQEKLLEEIKGLTPDHERRLQSIQLLEEKLQKRRVALLAVLFKPESFRARSKVKQIHVSKRASPQPAKPPEDVAKPAGKPEPESKEPSASETESSTPSKEEQMVISPSSTSVSSETTSPGQSDLQDSPQDQTKAAEEARERRLRLGSHGPETRKLVEALKEAEETLQQAVATTDNKDKIEVLIPQESPKVENGSQHSPSGQVLEPGKKVPPPPPPRKNWITSPTSPSPRSPAHSPPIISSTVQYTGKATDLDKAQTSYTTKTITTVFRSATSPTNKPSPTGNHNDNNNQVTNRREGGEGAEKDQRVWFSPTPTTHTIEREEDQDPQEKKRQLQEQYNILQQLQRENMQETSAEPEQLPEQASPTSPTSTSSSDSIASQVQQTGLGNSRVPPGTAGMEQNGGGDHRGGTAAVKTGTAALKTVTETIQTVTTDGQVKSETIIY